MNMAAGRSDDPEKTKPEQVMDKARKLWGSSHQPVKTFPWIRELDNFIQLILDLVLAVVKYPSVPLLVVTPLSEMSYCAHERKLKLVLFPFFLGTAVSGVLRRTALDISPLLKVDCRTQKFHRSSMASDFHGYFLHIEDPKRHQEQHCHMIQRISLHPCRQNTNRKHRASLSALVALNIFLHPPRDKKSVKA
ncbi:hypothetical protein TIFTF001_038924 [Ficus carica]|uniref:Uncharacterized protein n=1 Tax=Ficus carica TaxID=3494 RepID=A0AA88E8K4_FICCA|nr:hypothetical protein TIFTF001_038924 [Ficus carica]